MLHSKTFKRLSKVADTEGFYFLNPLENSKFFTAHYVKNHQNYLCIKYKLNFRLLLQCLTAGLVVRVETKTIFKIPRSITRIYIVTKVKAKYYACVISTNDHKYHVPLSITP